MQPPKAAVSLALLAFSEVMPFLPFKSNGLLHAALDCFHDLHVIPDDTYTRMKVTGAPESAHKEQQGVVVVDINNARCGRIKITCKN
jgi:hypothetical protein